MQNLRFTIRLKSNEREYLEKIAAESDSTPSGVLRSALREQMNEQQKTPAA